MRITVGLMAVALVAAAPVPTVKAGVDAWQRGDAAGAVAIWKPLAARGDADAAFNLGQAYKLGKGVPRDEAAAERLYRVAASQGHAQAQDELALALFRTGHRADAVPWLEKAAAQGQPRAQLVLGTMIYNGDAGAKNLPRAYALVTRAAQQGVPSASRTQAQMDGALSMEDRRQGLALARQMAGGTDSALVSGQAPPPPAPRARLVPPATNSGKGYAPRLVPLRSAPAGGGWRIQLGAFGSAANARSLWQRLQPRVAALRTLNPVYAASGAVTRLQAGPLASAAGAARACGAVRAAGNPCVPVAP